MFRHTWLYGRAAITITMYDSCLMRQDYQTTYILVDSSSARWKVTHTSEGDMVKYGQLRVHGHFLTYTASQVG